MKFSSSLELSTKLASINRTVKYQKDKFENDSEHSFQVALVSWSANHRYNLELNDEKILKLALVHDLLEIYTGDIDAHGGRVDVDKKSLEKQAFEKLKVEYPDIPEILEAIKEYEAKQSLESQLVNLIDKIIPRIHVNNLKDNYYIDRKVTLNQWVKWMKQKVDYDNLNLRFKQIADETIKEVFNYKGVFYDQSA